MKPTLKHPRDEDLNSVKRVCTGTSNPENQEDKALSLPIFAKTSSTSIVTAHATTIEEVTTTIKSLKRTKNIIFLDIDGVIYVGAVNDCIHQARMRNEINTIKSHPLIVAKVDSGMLDLLDKFDLSAVLGFSLEAVTHLRKLCIDYDAKIVISSQWRVSKSLAQLKQLFSIWDLGEFIIDITPHLPRQNRGAEIIEWLSLHPEVRSFVILDDVPNCIDIRFGERFIYCVELFSDSQLFEKAAAVLKNTFNYKNSEIKLCLDAIRKNSTQVKEVTLNIEKLTTLRIALGCNDDAAHEAVFTAFENNNQITHLTFTYYDAGINGFIPRLARLLQTTQMKLQYLNIAKNQLREIDELLSVIDGVKIQIPHINLNDNPFYNQEVLATWISSYPRPIKIDLDIANSGHGLIKLTEHIMDAVFINKNITISTQENLLPRSIKDTRMAMLISQGRLEVAKSNTKECCLQ